MKFKPQDTEKVYYLRGKLKPSSQIIAVGGGKGGVGKSFVSSSLAIFLANMGYKTVLVDVDLGQANLHTYFGMNPGKKSLSEFLNGEVKNISEIATESPVKNLFLIPGSNDALDMANINQAQKSKLMSAIFHLRADFTVLDLSAGTHATTLDFFLLAKKQILTITPDPSSIENAYRFIKASFFRKVKRYEFQLDLKSIIDELMLNKNKLGIRSPADLLYYVSKKDPHNGIILQNLMRTFDCNIIMNQVRSRNEADTGPGIQSVCNKYFGIESHYLGHVDYDNAVWQSLRKRGHLILECPTSRLYAQLLSITRILANPQNYRAVV